MLGCICGGVLEVLTTVGIASVVGWIVGKIMNRKCCDHSCDERE